ncbi:MAG: LURP-one-related family protein [Nitrososphaerota archaeon]|jgi:uncharacterized protein YxjI|nr:LURP-one-related family protein [Nitrososphaerota archaeon]
MKLYLKQKVLSWRNRFYVKDENGNDRFAAEGEIFTWGKKLHIYDTNGNEVAFIRQKVWALLPRYYVEINGRVVCEIVKELTLFKPKYRLEGKSWRLEGDFWAHEYSLTNRSQRIMHLSKKWFTWGDSYELDITNPQDELLCLCIALVVDCALAAQSNDSNT